MVMCCGGSFRGPCAGCALVELDGGRSHVGLTEG